MVSTDQVSQSRHRIGKGEWYCDGKREADEWAVYFEGGGVCLCGSKKSALVMQERYSTPEALAELREWQISVGYQQPVTP